MADYDLNEIADALAAVWSNMGTLDYDGVDRTVTSLSEIDGSMEPPAIGIELDDLNWDITMSRGADEFTFLAYLIVGSGDSGSGQRLVRQLLSTGGLLDKLKDKLEASKTLGGLVSYANLTTPRSIGRITWAGVDYQGAILEIEVCAQ